MSLDLSTSRRRQKNRGKIKSASTTRKKQRRFFFCQPPLSVFVCAAASPRARARPRVCVCVCVLGLLKPLFSLQKREFLIAFRTQTEGKDKRMQLFSSFTSPPAIKRWWLPQIGIAFIVLPPPPRLPPPLTCVCSSACSDCAQSTQLGLPMLPMLLMPPALSA